MVWADRVVACNALADAAGIHAGMKTGSAWALAPTLHVYTRTIPAEVQALQNLACWAGRLTPHVYMEAPNALLLEIGGCLRLFEGLDRLLDIACSESAGLGFSPKIGLAPTPRAALWRARAGLHEAWQDATATDLFGALAEVPVAALALEANSLAAVQAWGISRLGELLSLPREGLAARLGTGFVLQLAQALGELSDPRESFIFPERFSQRIEWPAPVEHTTAILFSSRRIIAALSGWLSRRASGLRECVLILEHPHQDPTQLRLRFAEPVYQASRIERLLRERLERHRLKDAVEALRLEATRIEPLQGEALALFGQAPPKNSVAEVLDRLRVRVGEEAVQILGARADHRPENAHLLASTPHVTASPAFPRPVWLTPKPRRLRERQGRPDHGGPLVLISGPERIESGWWDEGEAGATGDLRRDYFVAFAPNGQWLWIYRDQEGWWLHGLFA